MAIKNKRKIGAGMAFSLLSLLGCNQQSTDADSSPAAAIASVTPGTTLTIERLYSDPSLQGPAPINLKFSPDGSRVTFLQGKQQDYEQLDLWEYHIASGQKRILVDSSKLFTGKEQLSDEEKARRERKRIANKGIVEYHWSKTSDALLFPLNGDLYVAYLNKADHPAIQKITATAESETDPRFSPKGHYVSFIRQQNLYVIELSSGEEIQLTTDGQGSIKNGMAEFIAQEELDRFTGYWWSDDESAIAFSQVDESPVQIVQRYEIGGDSFKVFEQAYPATGTANVLVKVGVVSLRNRQITWMDLGSDTDFYLARLKWHPDNRTLAVQQLLRDNQTLKLLFIDSRTGQSRLILEEKSATWINLHNDLKFLQDQPQFIWASERTGFKHLYLYQQNGELIKPLTAGNWVVDDLLEVDEVHGLVYFDGYAKSPLEKHLYSTALKITIPSQPTAISQDEGWHEVNLASNSQFYLDAFSNPSTPPQVSLRRIDGSLVLYLEHNHLNDNHPYFPYWQYHAHPEFGSIKASDGQDLYYRIIKPKAFDPNIRYPVIFSFYGGPHGHLVKKVWTGGDWHQVMAAQDYIIFTLDNRGSYHRGKAFEDPLYLRLGHVEVEDQTTAARYLASLPYVDEQRIGVFGWSYGGYMALMTMMKSAEHFKAGVAVAPVTDWRLYDTAYTERYMGHPDQHSEAYDNSAVFPYVDQLQGPLLMIHGMADDNVLFTNSTKLYQLLQSKDIPFEMMTYPGSKHGIRGKKIRTHLFKGVIEFFNRHFKPQG